MWTTSGIDHCQNPGPDRSMKMPESQETQTRQVQMTQEIIDDDELTLEHLVAAAIWEQLQAAKQKQRRKLRQPYLFQELEPTPPIPEEFARLFASF